jgi:MoxR-like ATPase
MNEGQVSIDGSSYALPRPFMVIATQNPVEYHGTFPLPEAQLDRFLLRIEMGYPDAESEKDILRSNGDRIDPAHLQPAMHADEVLEIQKQVPHVHVHEDVLDYILAVVQATREHPHLSLGVSPRGSIALHRAAQAAALIDGRSYVTPHDVKSLVKPVFAHRIAADRRFGAEAEAVERSEQVLDEILTSIPAPL